MPSLNHEHICRRDDRGAPVESKRMPDDQSPHQVLGEDKIKALASSLYEVVDELPDAKCIRGMHGKIFADIKQKLAECLICCVDRHPLHYEKRGAN
jgi:hemoglobin